jgi:membrane protein DedA with SNARE-associated domain
MPKTPRRPDPEPLETDDRRIVLVGIALWVVAFVVLAVAFRDDLRRHHTTWWLWSCGIGVALGLYGLHFTAKRRRHREPSDG